MKKTLYSILFFTVLFLTGCTNYTEVEMIKSEVATLINDISFEESTERIINISLDIDLEIDGRIIMEYPEGMESQSSTLKVEGKLDLYADLRTYDRFRVYAEFDLEINVEEGFFTPISGMQSASVGSIYVDNENAYINVIETSDHSEMTIKGQDKSNISEASFNELKTILTNLDNIIPLKDSLSKLDYTTYQSNDKYKLITNDFEVTVNTFYENIFTKLFGLEMSSQEVTLENKDNYKSEMTLYIGNYLESLKSSNNLSHSIKAVYTEADFYKITFDINIKLINELTINFNARFPKSVDLDELKEYPRLGAGMPSPF